MYARLVLMALMVCVAGCASVVSSENSSEASAPQMETWTGTVVHVSRQAASQVGSVVLAPARLITAEQKLSLLSQNINQRLTRAHKSKYIFQRVGFIFIKEPPNLPKLGESWRINCVTEIDGSKWLISTNKE
jgi:hypothetical protein